MISSSIMPAILSLKTKWANGDAAGWQGNPLMSIGYLTSPFIIIASMAYIPQFLFKDAGIKIQANISGVLGYIIIGLWFAEF